MKAAVVLAGGRGTRLGALTRDVPKALVPLGGMPVLEVILRQLAAAGVRDVTLALGHLAGRVRDYAGDGARFGLAIRHVVESAPRGTIGPVADVPELPEDFLVVNADLLTDFDFAAFGAFHREHGGLASLAVREETAAIPCGLVATDGAGRVTGFEEKPVTRRRINLGIYAFRRAVLDFLAPGARCDADELFARLLAADAPVHAFPFAGRWIDVGEPHLLARARAEFARDRRRYLPA